MKMGLAVTALVITVATLCWFLKFKADKKEVVLPIAPPFIITSNQLTTADFAVLIGAAINWRNQGIYYSGQRLKAEGHPMPDILKAKKHEAQVFDSQFTIQVATFPCNSQCTRQDFERRNSQADAAKDISAIQTPVLILMGKDDRNVDPDETVAVWAEALPSGTYRCIKQLPGATHGLLRSEWFDYQLATQWPLWKQGLFLLLGKYSYSPGHSVPSHHGS
ncbi:lysophospholipase [Yersinia canariae]|uniref:lysophospholipase n=1 Tax=Yersinia canariae TaxID=2607663 RepID=UPI001FE5DC12|nr:lysophospholipase [Yersinia canariae]